MIPLSLHTAEKVAVFEEFGRPGGIIILDGYIYIQEKTTVFIYKLKDFTFLKSFGKEGEGPGEIKMNMFGGPLTVLPNDRGQIVITSAAKVSFFSKTGEYLKEFKVNQFDSYYPIGDKYICTSSTASEDDKAKLVLALFMADENLKKGKIIYRTDFETGANFKFVFPITPFYPDTDGDKLFIIAGIHGFAIDVFNKNGDKLYRISKKFKPRKVPSTYKKKTIDWFKADPTYQSAWDFFRQRIEFNEYFPPIYRMNTDNGRIYVFSSTMKGDQRECVVMDHRGNEVKRLFLHLPERYGMDFYDIYTIKNNYFYRLVENEDEENWELHRTKIE
jgi:hypothetical protein